MKSFLFSSPVTSRIYEVTEFGLRGSRNRDEGAQVLAHLVLEEWEEILETVAAGTRGQNLGIGHKSLWEEGDLDLMVGVPIPTRGPDKLAPMLFLARALRAKKEELESKLKSAISLDHPMVVMAARIARHLGHGWVHFAEGEKNLAGIEARMGQYEERCQGPFGAGIWPPLCVVGTDPYVEQGKVAMEGVSGTGRYSWSVNYRGELKCDICRPNGVAVHISISHDRHDSAVVGVKRGVVDFEDRHLEAAEGVIEACAGADFVKPAMTKSLITVEEFDAWRQRRNTESSELDD